MVFLNRLALVLVLAGALFFSVRNGGKEAVSGNPEPLWESSVERVDAMITEDTGVTVTDSLRDSAAYAEGVSEDVTAVAD